MKPIVRNHAIKKAVKDKAMKMGMFILQTFLEERAKGHRDFVFLIRVYEVNGQVTFDINPDIQGNQA